MIRSKALCLLLLLSSMLLSADLRLSGANRAEYWVFVDDRLDTLNLNYKEHLTEKLKLALTYGDITLRGIFFFWDPSLAIQNSMKYIDFSAQYKKDPVSLLYGRYYATFGRGLCLNQFLDEDFNNDNSLYGLKADINILKSQFTFLTGQPRNIFFEELQYGIKNGNDSLAQIRGANIETQIPLPKTSVNLVTKVGGRYVRVNRENDLNPQSFTELFGGNAGLTIGPWENYFEWGRQWGVNPVNSRRVKGDGFIYTTGLAIPGFGISAQYIDYTDLGFGGPGYRYNETPTPIKSGISLNRGIDEIGYGVALVASPFDFISLEIENNKVSSHDEDEPYFQQIIAFNDDLDGVLEQIVKVITHPSYNMEITVGAERVIKQGIELPIQKKTETKPHIEITYDFGSFFIDAGYEHNLVSSDSSDYYDHAASLSIGKPEMFVLSFRYERRNRVPEWLIPKLGEETSWPMFELSYDITTRHNLRLRIGAEKGGLVCSGGVCRFEEPFRGVKLVLTSLF
jgi:hypothetical protein